MPLLGWLRQENYCEFKDSLGYIVSGGAKQDYITILVILPLISAQMLLSKNENDLYNVFRDSQPALTGSELQYSSL